MADSAIVLRPKKFFLDIFIWMHVALPTIFVYELVSPFKRGFFCNDADLRYPYRDTKVQHFIYLGACVLLTCLVMIVTEYLNSSNDNREVRLGKRSLPVWLYDSYCAVGMFSFGAACCQLAAVALKFPIGRLRPYFIEACAPDVCALTNNGSDPLKYFEEFTCTNPAFGDQRSVSQLRTSFPSSNSCLGMYTMLYLAIYLHKRMSWDGSKLLKHVIQFVAIMLGVYLSLLRISEYKHFWSDVLGGMLLGCFTAVITARYFSNLLDKPCERYSAIEALTNCQGKGNRDQLV